MASGHALLFKVKHSLALIKAAPIRSKLRYAAITARCLFAEKNE